MSALDLLSDGQLAGLADEYAWVKLERALTRSMLDKLLAGLLTRTVVVATPAAGADFTVSVPGGSVWYLRMASAKLVASATVANRQASFTFTQAGSLIWSTVVQLSQTAGQTLVYNLGAVSLVTNTIGQPVGIPIPAEPMPLGNASAVASSTSALQAGDQWGPVTLYVLDLSPARILQAARWLCNDLDAAGGPGYPRG